MITASNTAGDGQIHARASSAPILDLLMSMMKSALFTSWRAYTAHRARQIAKARLMALDERMLKDIGIHRSEIHSVLMDRARQRRRGFRSELETYF
jgi:uncharacterized protein YjiS (DUF1127 family)